MNMVCLWSKWCSSQHWKVLSESDLSCWILKRNFVHRWAGLIIKSGKLAQNLKCKVPDICDIELCGLHMFYRIFKTLCSAHLLTFITFTFGFYLLLFIWGSKSFPECSLWSSHLCDGAVLSTGQRAVCEAQ